MAPMASYMIFSAVLFLPPYIIMLTNFATIRLPYLGSGRISRLAAPARRIYEAPPAFGCFAPYFERLCFRPATPAVSSDPRMIL